MTTLSANGVSGAESNCAAQNAPISACSRCDCYFCGVVYGAPHRTGAAGIVLVEMSGRCTRGSGCGWSDHLRQRNLTGVGCTLPGSKGALHGLGWSSTFGILGADVRDDLDCTAGTGNAATPARPHCASWPNQQGGFRASLGAWSTLPRKAYGWGPLCMAWAIALVMIPGSLPFRLAHCRLGLLGLGLS